MPRSSFFSLIYEWFEKTSANFRGSHYMVLWGTLKRMKMGMTGAGAPVPHSNFRGGTIN